MLLETSHQQTAVASAAAAAAAAAAAGRQKKSLEMVVNLLKRPSSCAAPATQPDPSFPSSAAVPVTSSASTSGGHVMVNGGTADESLLRRVIVPAPAHASAAYRQLAPPPTPPTAWSHFRFRSVAAGSGPLSSGAESAAGRAPAPPIRQLKQMCSKVRSFVPSGQRGRRGGGTAMASSSAAAAAPWRGSAALEMLFSAVPVTRHRAAVPQFPARPRAAGGPYLPSRPARFPANASAAAGLSRDPRRSREHDGQLSLLSLLLEASGTSCCRAMTSSVTSSSVTSLPPSTAQLWKAAIN